MTPENGSGQPQNIATAITEVSDRLTLLVREEIELAKAEVSAKVSKLVRGAAIGAAAGIFVVAALLLALHGFAWLAWDLLPVGAGGVFWGYFAVAVLLLLLGGLAGFIAAKAVKSGSPPTPAMAIDEARKIRETVSSPSTIGTAANVGGPGIVVPEKAR